jgi:lipopolysaccharide transport system ATP-binding protein
MSDTDIVIKVENISKRYRIGLKEEMHDSFLATTIDFLKSPLKNYRRYRSLYVFNDNENKDELYSDDESTGVIWPLKNVSFQMKRGEVLGIVGRNGAGKSTLLKILSRITDPTKGRIEMRGKVASLLEVGTGFHPELTGRENVYLNGTILGMRKNEIDHKFDEIVEFSGIEKFIDTPVKRYSSGMSVRLAFSVAAHLRSDVMIIDEVLAVGDAEFQKKCLSKMDDVSQQGRTVIFVSHSMPAVLRLCKRVIMIDKGLLMIDGPPAETVAKYLQADTETSAKRLWPDVDEAPGNDCVRLRSVKASSEDGHVLDSYDIRNPINLEIEYEVFEPDKILATHFHLENAYGVRVFSIHDTDPEWMGRPRPVGHYRCKTQIPGNLLSEGLISVGVVVLTMDPIDTQCWVDGAIAFTVFDSFEGITARGDWPYDIQGAVRPLLKWTTDLNPLNT